MFRNRSISGWTDRINGSSSSSRAFVGTDRRGRAHRSEIAVRHDVHVHDGAYIARLAGQTKGEVDDPAGNWRDVRQPAARTPGVVRARSSASR
jgi:hypothetical protein